MAVVIWWNPSNPPDSTSEPEHAILPNLDYKPRDANFDTSGYVIVMAQMKPWSSTATLEEIGSDFAATPDRIKNRAAARLADSHTSSEERLYWTIVRAWLLNFQGKPADAYKVLEEARTIAESDTAIAEQMLYTIIYFQGVTALRTGETENCIMCRGESSCILPIVPAAVHTNPRGSRLAIQHFTEYLDRFPDDLDVRWLLNIAHMTLGEHPQDVESNQLLTLAPYLKSEFDIGRFRDVGHLVGVNRFNFQGGGIMDDFDNDGLLDIVVTSNNPTESMAFYRNKGDGTFEQRIKEAGLEGQLGGLYCVQADFDNDGCMDIFVPRGAWTPSPVRPSLLRNNGKGTFTDVTKEAGLDAALNSLSACWADFDNDGYLDLFIPCGPQKCRLYRNKGNGTFEDVAEKAGLTGDKTGPGIWRSAAWIDFDNDGYPDLFINTIGGTAILYRNNRNGTFSNVTTAMGIDGPLNGFSCWAFDYDNDGWPDIFATCYNYTLSDVVRGLQGQPHSNQSNRLYKNLGGKGFKDVTKEAGLDMVFATMGSNFGDFDGDGYLDMYLATGGPDLPLIVPNRMFKNVGGQALRRNHGLVANRQLAKGPQCRLRRLGSKWDARPLRADGRGDVRRPVPQYLVPESRAEKQLAERETGWQENEPLRDRARIKVVTAGENPLTVYRNVTSGSSFGANPLEQMIGLGKTDRIALLEINWPTSGTTQTFRDLPANQAIEITEFAKDFRQRKYQAIPLPK